MPKQSERSVALRFVLMIGMVSLFADAAYEGARSITGPYMALFGAMAGPLAVAAVLAHHGDYRTAFAMLLIPALMTLALIVTARLVYPKPAGMESDEPHLQSTHFPRTFWVYLTGAALVAAGFPD